MQAPEYPAPDEHGNYDSPPLRAIRKVWEDYLAGIASDEDLALTLQAVHDRAQIEIDELTRQVEQGESKADDPVFQAILEAFEQIQGGVDHLFLELDEPEQGHFQEGLQMVQSANNQMIAAHKKMYEAMVAMSRVSCMFCGQDNERGTERCAKCGRNLPTAAPTSTFSAVASEEGVKSEQEGEMTENFARIAQAMEAWRAGQVEGDTLLTLIEEIEQNMVSHQDANAQYREAIVKYPPETHETFYEAIDATEAGLTASLEALERMKIAFDRDDGAFLEAGFLDLEEANKAVVAAFKAMDSAAKAFG